MTELSRVDLQARFVHIEVLFCSYDKRCLDHNEAITMPRWISAGAVSVALLSCSRLEGRT